jgi:anti-anti-sigma factor
METKIDKIGDETLITVIGRMDTMNAKQFEQDIQPLLKEPKLNVSVDCADLLYISSSGLRTFITLLKYSKTVNGSITMKNMRPEVREIFDMTGFSSFFNMI